VEKSIELYTLGAAYAQYMEDRKGMIKEGYLADMVIYDRDLMTMPEEDLMTALVDYTIVGGNGGLSEVGGLGRRARPSKRRLDLEQ